MTTPAEIAARLTEDGAAFPTEDMLADAYRELHTLETFGLAAQQAWQWRLTPLGLAVRAHLAQEARDER